MANDIDLWHDIKRAETLHNHATKAKDYLMAKAWKKEYNKLMAKYTKKYILIK